MNGFSIEELYKLLDSIDSKLDFWIRCDDVGKYDENTIRLIELFNRYDMDVILCMIPTIIDEKYKDYIASGKFILSQHGYSHKNRASVGKCELSDERDGNEVLDEMFLGKKKLIDMFNQEVEVLTPPFNKIDSNTQILLKDHYHTLSVFADHKSCFREDRNPYVDIVNWHQREFGGEEFSNRQILKAMNHTDSIGICIHPNCLNEAGFNYLENLFEMLSSSKGVKVRRK